MYCIVERHGRGSWRVTQMGKVFEDRERAADVASDMRKRVSADRSFTVDHTYAAKVVYMGNADDWQDA